MYLRNIRIVYEVIGSVIDHDMDIMSSLCKLSFSINILKGCFWNENIYEDETVAACKYL